MLDTVHHTIENAPPETVRQWVDNNQVLLVDVRETAEFEREYIAGALLLPMSSFEPDMFPAIAGKKVVLYCAIGKRSEAAGKMLLAEGHTGIVHMTGGLSAWKAAGFPIEEQIQPPATKTPEPVFLCPAPGRVLQNEYLTPLRLGMAELADQTGLSPDTLAAILKNQMPVGVEESLRLARYFSTAPDFWSHLQLDHDMERARHRLGAEIRREILPRCAG